MNVYNLAIYPDNFRDKSYIRLMDFHKPVSKDREKINKSNHSFFKFDESIKDSSIQ